jgi:hypothetical protein
MVLYIIDIIFCSSNILFLNQNLGICNFQIQDYIYVFVYRKNNPKFIKIISNPHLIHVILLAFKYSHKSKKIIFFNNHWSCITNLRNHHLMTQVFDNRT